MYYFLNDYSDICKPEILDELKNAINEKNPGYGFDKHSEEARNLIKKALKDESVDIHFVPGGTSANILGVTAGLRPEESVISALSGHIEGHESGSIEATGVKIETIPTSDGKLTPELLEKKLKHFGTEYMTVPRTVYISNTSELGTVYSKKEIEKIYEFCKERDLYLFIDGARMAAALAVEEADLKLEDLTSLCDSFTLGGTKNGLIFGEALVIVNDELKRGYLNLIKQKGAMMAKGFILGISFKTLFKDPQNYVEGAITAQKCAKRLAEGLVEKGFTLDQEFESNQVFLRVNKDELERIERIAKVAVTGYTDDDQPIVRFVTTYQNSLEEIENFLKEI